MKKEDITGKYLDELNDCKTHKCKPSIVKVSIAPIGFHFLAVCESEDCGIGADTPEELIIKWNEINAKN